MNSTPTPMSRKGLAKDTDETQKAREENIRSLTKDPRWRLLNGTDRRHMRALLAWHDPLTGYLRYRTRHLNLIDVLDVSEETLRRSRLRLIAAGLIVSYVPGTGHIASTYCVARSWAEADEAAGLRRQPDAPHFPELVDRTPSAVDQRPAPAPAETDAGDAPEDPGEVAEAQERYERARRRRGVRGAVPPELPLPNPGVQRPLVAEIDKRRADVEHQSDTNQRGRASLREAYEQARRVPTASGAA